MQVIASQVGSISSFPEIREQYASFLSEKMIHQEVMENLYRLDLPWHEKASILCDAVPDVKYSLPYLQYWLLLGRITDDEYLMLCRIVLLSFFNK